MLTFIQRPFGIYLLLLLLLLQGIGALYGGFKLINDPSGNSLKMPAEWLKGTPFPDFRIPGLVLFIVLGILPTLLVGALWAKPDWPWADLLNLYSDRHWAWTYTLYIGIALILWIDFQIYWVGYSMILQTIFALIGVAIVVLTLLPGVQRYFEVPG